MNLKISLSPNLNICEVGIFIFMEFKIYSFVYLSLLVYMFTFVFVIQ